MPDPAPQVHSGVTFEKVALTPSDASSHYFIPLSVEGKDTRFLLDSGAGTIAVLSTPFAESLGVPLTEIGDGGAVGGALKMHSTNLSAFKVGPFPRLKLGGIIGTKTLLALDACLDFGSYSLIVPSRLEKK